MDLIKKCKYAILCLSICVPSIAFSAVFGHYDSTNRSNFDFNSQQSLNTYIYLHPLIDAHDARIGYFCHDGNLVPGKLINGSCYIAFNGNDYRHEEYNVLRNPTPSFPPSQYKLLAIHNFLQFNQGEAKQFIKDLGVTPGGMYQGNYMYHCYVLEGHTGRSAFGHYNPDANKCTYELHGDQYIVPTDHTSSYMQGWEVSVLVSIPGGVPLPSGMSFGSALNNPYNPPVGGSGPGGGGGHIQ